MSDAWDVTAEVEVAAFGAGIGARIALVQPDGALLGTRTIETDDPTCTTVAEGLGLVVAMLVDLHERDAVLRVVHPVVPVEAWENALVVHGAVDVGWLPNVALVPSAELLFGPGALVRVLLRAGVVLPQRSVADIGAAEVWGAIGAAGACVLPHLDRWELGGCVAAEGGWLSVAGDGLPSTNTSDAGHVAALASLRALVTLDALVLGVELGASLPILRQRFVYTAGAEQLYFESSPVTLRGALVIGIR